MEYICFLVSIEKSSKYVKLGPKQGILSYHCAPLKFLFGSCCSVCSITIKVRWLHMAKLHPWTVTMHFCTSIGILPAKLKTKGGKVHTDLCEHTKSLAGINVQYIYLYTPSYVHTCDCSRNSRVIVRVMMVRVVLIFPINAFFEQYI